MSKLYLRIISWFLAMVVFAVGVLVFSLFWFSARNERDFSERIQENMRQVDQRISEQYAAINNASVAIMGNKIVQENLRPYSALTVENRYQYAAICSLLLQSRFQLNDFVDSMFLYVDGVRVLYQNGTSESRTFYDKIIQYASYRYDFWISTLDARKKDVIILPADWYENDRVGDRRLVVPVVFRNMLMASPFVLVSNVSVKSIWRMYEESAVFSDSVYVLYDPAQDTPIYNGGLPGVWSPEIAALETGSRTRLGGTAYTANVAPVSTFGWRVLCLTPMAAFSNVNAYFRFTTGWLVCMFLVLGVVLAWISSRRIYEPIRTMRHDIALYVPADNPAWQTDELSFLRDSIRAMADDREIYRLKNRQFATQYVTQGLAALMEGHPVVNEQGLIQTIAREVGFEAPCFQCVDILLDFHQETSFSARDELLGTVSSFAVQVLSRAGNALSIRYRENMLVVVLNLTSGCEEKICALCKEILAETLVDDTVCTARIGVGGQVARVSDIALSFGQANTAVWMLPTGESGAVAVHGQVQPGTYAYDGRALFDAVSARDLERIEEAIRTALEEAKRARVRYTEAVELVQEISAAAYRLESLADQAHAPATHVSPDALPILLLSPEANPSPLMDLFIRVLGGFVMDKERRAETTALKVKRHIDAQYAKDLSLDIIADALNVSAKYVSRVFKEELGVNVSDYIAQVRTHEAKELLKGELSLTAIAEAVGVKNRTTFVRMFRKVEGVTPGEYRRMLGGEDGEE